MAVVSERAWLALELVYPRLRLVDPSLRGLGRLGGPRASGANVDQPHFFAAGAAVAEWLADFRPDVIHAHDPHGVAMASVALSIEAAQYRVARAEIAHGVSRLVNPHRLVRIA